jgi:hypothetical protein
MTPSPLSTLKGSVEFKHSCSGRTRVTLRPSCDYISRLTCEMSHPEELPLFLEHGVSFQWLCDAISRIEDPNYVYASAFRLGVGVRMPSSGRLLTIGIIVLPERSLDIDSQHSLVTRDQTPSRWYTDSLSAPTVCLRRFPRSS